MLHLFALKRTLFCALAGILGAGSGAGAAENVVNTLAYRTSIDHGVDEDLEPDAEQSQGGATKRTGTSPTRAPAKTPTVEVVAKGTAEDWPDTLATARLDYRESVAAPSDFQDWVSRVPGVTATGQNGLFETFSIRGSAGNGLLVIAAGMPLSAQRRAGVPVAFIEPALLGDVRVVRGPAVVHFGPGALGGAVSIEPRWFDQHEVSAGFASSANEAWQTAATGAEDYSMAVARHRMGLGEAADGTPLNIGFERASATLQFRQSLGTIELDALLMPSRSVAIGKSNIRFPARQTRYPEDEHTLGRLRLRSDDGWVFSLQGHDQYLGTLNQRPGGADSFAGMSSLDLGATLQRSIEHGRFRHNVGLEYLGRRQVNAYEARGSLANRSYTLRDARERGVSLFAITDWRIDPALALELGLRQSWLEQAQSGADHSLAASGFNAGARWSSSQYSQWTLTLASGYRFPSLEERFYTGVTGQGEVVGNPALSAERSLGLDLGYQWLGQTWGAELHVWRNQVNDLIQLTALGAGLNGYENVSQAQLYGAEAQLQWRLRRSMELSAGLDWARSQDRQSAEPLYGTAAPGLQLGAAYQLAKWRFGLRYVHRWAMRRPGFEELPRPARDLLDAEVEYRFSDNLLFSLFARNLGNARYFATADELSALAPGRSLGVRVHYRAPAARSW